MKVKEHAYLLGIIKWDKNKQGDTAIVVKKNVMATGATPSHLLHFFLTTITFGCWLFIWILICASKLGGYRCTECGGKV